MASPNELYQAHKALKEAYEALQTAQENVAFALKLLSQDPTMPQPQQPQASQPPTVPNAQDLNTIDGAKLATLVKGSQINALLVIFEEKHQLNRNTPPFTNFFVERILLKIRNKDLEQGKANASFNYQIITEGDLLREIKLENVSEERQKEIVTPLRWTLEKMLQKQSEQQAATPAAKAQTPSSQPQPTPSSPQPTPYQPTNPTGLRAVQDIRMMFPEELDALLSFEDKGSHIELKPKQFMDSTNFAKISSTVRGLGGEYISAPPRGSHWRVYKSKQGGTR